MGVDEKGRKAIRGDEVVFRIRAALKQALDAGGRRSKDWNTRDAIVGGC